MLRNVVFDPVKTKSSIMFNFHANTYRNFDDYNFCKIEEDTKPLYFFSPFNSSITLSFSRLLLAKTDLSYVYPSSVLLFKSSLTMKDWIIFQVSPSIKRIDVHITKGLGKSR